MDVYDRFKLTVVSSAVQETAVYEFDKQLSYCIRDVETPLENVQISSTYPLVYSNGRLIRDSRFDHTWDLFNRVTKVEAKKKSDDGMNLYAAYMGVNGRDPSGLAAKIPVNSRGHEMLLALWAIMCGQPYSEADTQKMITISDEAYYKGQVLCAELARRRRDQMAKAAEERAAAGTISAPVDYNSAHNLLTALGCPIDPGSQMGQKMAQLQSRTIVSAMGMRFSMSYKPVAYAMSGS